MQFFHNSAAFYEKKAISSNAVTHKERYVIHLWEEIASLQLAQIDISLHLGPYSLFLGCLSHTPGTMSL